MIYFFVNHSLVQLWSIPLSSTLNSGKDKRSIEYSWDFFLVSTSALLMSQS